MAKSTKGMPHISDEAVKTSKKILTSKGRVPPHTQKKKVVLGNLRRNAGNRGGGTATGPGTYANLLYQGGPVVYNPQLYTIFLGDWSGTDKQTRLTNLNQFVTDFLNSSYMNILAQYGNTGTTGNFIQSVQIADSSTSLTDGDLQTVIQTAINNSQLPEPVANSSIVYIFFLDDSMVVTSESLCETNGAFGYHNSFTTTANNGAYYAVVLGLTDACVTTVCSNIPVGYYCSIDKSNTTQLQRQTQVASHELSEMFSDPLVGNGLAWNDNDFSDGEIGDLCNGQVGTITVGTNVWNVQLMYSKWDDLITNGSAPCVATASSPYPSLVPQFYFTVNKNMFGVGEVTDTPAYPKAFWLTLEGYSASQLGTTTPNLSGTLTTDTDLHISNPTVVYELPGDQYTPQRIMFYYDITFNAPPFTHFPGVGSQPVNKTLHASIAMPEYTPTADTDFVLVAGADPYFSNVNTNDPNAVFYLSEDLRVITATPHYNNAPVAGPPAYTADSADAAYTYIQGVLSYLNDNSNHFTDGTHDPFADGTIPGLSGNVDNDTALSLVTIDNSVTPAATYNNYSFAIARVRLTGSTGSQADPVKVFFRLFVTQTGDTDYLPNTSYKSNPDNSQTPATPLSPLLGTDGSGGTDNSTLLCHGRLPGLQRQQRVYREQPQRPDGDHQHGRQSIPLLRLLHKPEPEH